jgi:hypothetical protein
MRIFAAEGALGSPPLRCYNAAGNDDDVRGQGLGMGNKLVIMTARPALRYRMTAVSAAVALAVGCSLFASPVAAQSLGDRFKSLFGGGSSDQPAQGAPGAPDPGPSETRIEETCPTVSIRAGASTYKVAAPGKEAVGNDVRFQATITKTARDCRRTGDDITARIGIQGRVISGPAGAPETIEVPLRVAVVQSGVNEKTIATKAYRTTVSLAEGGSVPFTLVVDDLVYPIPPGATGDSYIFYIGFDPQALTPEPKAPVKRAKKK